MASSRHLSRIVVLQTLTMLILRDQSKSEEIRAALEYVQQEFAPNLDRSDKFALTMVQGVVEHRNALDTEIELVAPEWPIEKLSALERIILEMGAFELIFQKDTPLPVIINESVELAKEFGDETAKKFVNGVLSSIGDIVRPGEKPQKTMRNKKTSSIPT